MARLKDRLDQFHKWRSKQGLVGQKAQMKELVANRPEYVINDNYYDNAALAKARAFGRDRTIQMADENVDQDVSAATSQAKNITGNTGAVLDTLRAIATSGMDQKRNLAMQESSLRDQRMGEVYNTNNAIAEENDKAWNFNVNEPYQNKIQALRDKRKFRQELAMKAIDLAGTVGAAALTGGTSLVAKGAGQAMAGATQAAAGGGADLMAPIDGYGNNWSNYG